MMTTQGLKKLLFHSFPQRCNKKMTYEKLFHENQRYYKVFRMNNQMWMDTMVKARHLRECSVHHSVVKTSDMQYILCKF